MVRYFIAVAAICSAASLVARSEATEQKLPRHLRKLYSATSVSVSESVPTYYPTYSPTTEIEPETTAQVKTVTIKNDSWKCAPEIVEVRSWGAPATISTIDEVWYGSAGYTSTKSNISTSVGRGGKNGGSTGVSKVTSASKVSKVGVNGGKGGKRGVVGSTSVESTDIIDSTSEEGWSTGDGWHSAVGGRRLSASWGASAEVKESPEIVWIGSAQSTAKADKVPPESNGVGWGSSVSSVSIAPPTTAKADKVVSVSNRDSWGSSVSTVKAGKPVSTSNAVNWGASVSVSSTNAPTICQTIVEAFPTMYPTEAPTSCSSRYVIWYFNTDSGRCVNDDTDTEFLEGEYESMDKCCEGQFPDNADYEYCKLYLYEDKCCSMQNHLWFYDSLLEVCTNDLTMVVDNETTEFYNDDFDCCKGEFPQSYCPIRDVCIPELPETILTAEPSKEPTLAPSAEPSKKPTPAPSAAPSKKPTPAPSAVPTTKPTQTPSEAPTTCVDLYSIWYYDVSSGKCVTGMSESENEGFGSVEECCGAQFSDKDKYEFCKEYLHVDTCCLIEHNVWHFDGKVCTNSGVMEGSNGSIGYDEDFECCIDQFKQYPCPVKNICIPEPPKTASPTPQPSIPELVTSVPTVPEIMTEEPTTAAPVTNEPTTSAPITPFPTETEVVTLAPTTSAPISSEPTVMTPEPSTLAPTINEIITVAPSFGSTPTVSKETTGPPTLIREEIRAASSFTEDVNTDCVEHNDKVWSTESNSMVEVCVYVCTVTTTIYDGEDVYDTKVHKTNGECP